MRRIILTNTPPTSGSGLLLCYDQSVLNVKGWDNVDVRHIINKNKVKWLHDVYNWHGHLTEKLSKISNFYSLLPVSRLILWETTNRFSLKPLLFLLALIKIFDKTDKDILIINPDEFLVSFIHEWLLNSDTHLENKLNTERRQWLKKRVRANIFHHVKSFFTIGRVIYSLLFHIKRSHLPKIDVVVSSTLINQELLHKNGDHFFGLMIEDSFRKTDKNIVWIYNDLFVKNRRAIDLKLKKIGRNAFFLADFFCWSDLLFSIKHSFITARKIKKEIHNLSFPINIEGLKSKEFSSSFVKNLALYEIPLIELMTYRQYVRLFNTKNPSSIVFPYEGKAMENALLLANKAANKKVKSIGYAHAGYSDGHLFVNRHKKEFIPRPDKIAVTGPDARNRFIIAGVPEREVVIVGTPRYQEYIDTNFTTNRFGALNVLFICGLGFEMIRFANMLVENKELACNNLIIRRSFHSWKEEQDMAEKILFSEKVPFSSTSNVNLFEDIDNADVVLYESTSAAFQASLRGKLVFKVFTSDVMTTEHFIGKKVTEKVDICLDSDSLMKMLDRVKLMTSEEYKELAALQRSKFNDIYSEIDTGNIKCLLG